MSDRPNPLLIGILVGGFIWGMILLWDSRMAAHRFAASAKLAASVRAPVVVAPAPRPSETPWRSDFNFAKRDREYDWCEKHGGVADMTFDSNGSNVLCVKRSAVIPIPQKDGGP